VVARGVEARDGADDAAGVAIDGLFEDGGEGGAGVLDVGVDAAADEGLLADVAAGEVEAAIDAATAKGFDLLSEELADDGLLGEVLGANDDARGAWGRAGGQADGSKEEGGVERACDAGAHD